MTFASRAVISLGRIGEVMTTEPSMTYVDGDAAPVAGDIHFDHVTFTYPGDAQPTLKDVTFTVSGVHAGNRWGHWIW